jgi:hypothetical protein
MFIVGSLHLAAAAPLSWMYQQFGTILLLADGNHGNCPADTHGRRGRRPSCSRSLSVLSSPPLKMSMASTSLSVLVGLGAMCVEGGNLRRQPVPADVLLASSRAAISALLRFSAYSFALPNASFVCCSGWFSVFCRVRYECCQARPREVRLWLYASVWLASFLSLPSFLFSWLAFMMEPYFHLSLRPSALVSLRSIYSVSSVHCGFLLFLLN